MYSTPLPAYDRRAFMSVSPRDLQPGEGFIIDAVYSYHISSSGFHLDNVNTMQEEVPVIKAKFESHFSTLCSQTVYCETDCVWPGDADQSGRVDKDDILEIGVGAGHSAMGANRNPVSYDWIPQHAEEWDNAFIDGTNYKHADCNGDGAISPSDAILLDQNYGYEVPASWQLRIIRP